MHSRDPVVNVKSFTSIGTVFGGGLGESALMVGSPTVNVNVGLGEHASYSGTAVGFSEGSYAGTEKTFDGVTVRIPDHAAGKIGAISTVFGGGNAAPVDGNTTVNIGTEAYVPIVTVEAGADVSSYYTRSGGGTAAYTYTKCAEDAVATEGTTYYIPVLGADIRGNVYGGGNAADVTGRTNVVIGKKAE